MANHPNRSKRGPGRPPGRDPDAKQTVTIALRPSEQEALATKHPDGWRARLRELIDADLA